MRRLWRVLRWTGISLAGLLIVAYGTAYGLSSVKVRRTHAVEKHQLVIPRDPASVAEGERLARTRGCLGCHGPSAGGRVMVDEWLLARLVAPDLTRSLREYSTDELEGIIRHGVRPDGKSVIVMPSSMYASLTDQDLGAILGYLRTLAPAEGPRPGVRLGPLARVMFAVGEFSPEVVNVRRAAELDVTFPARTDSNWAGAYLARTACTECHQPDLRGRANGKPPDLRIAAAYSLEAFTRLLRTGKAIDGGDRGLMSEVSVGRFSHFTDAEIASLHRYLVARASQ